MKQAVAVVTGASQGIGRSTTIRMDGGEVKSI
jgi:short-subunit dehydrogenase